MMQGLTAIGQITEMCFMLRGGGEPGGLLYFTLQYYLEHVAMGN